MNFSKPIPRALQKHMLLRPFNQRHSSYRSIFNDMSQNKKIITEFSLGFIGKVARVVLCED